MKYATLSKNPGKFYRFTGIPIEVFNTIAHDLEPLWQEAERERLSRSNRKRAIGGGGTYKLKDFKDKLLVALFYYRLYLTYEVLQEFFNVHYANLNRLVNRLEPLLAKRIKPRIPKGLKKRIGSWEEFSEAYPDLVDIVIDATGQRLRKPKGERKQKKYYSGKHKAHIMKTQIAISRVKHILSASESVPGRMHDYPLLKKSNLLSRLPPQIIKHVDLGYLGAENDFPDHKWIIPQRKPRMKELSRRDAKENRGKASFRIIVEHVFAALKKFQILAQIYRNKRNTYNQKFQIVAGLYNLRMEFVA